jgi:hypothetical protein
MKVSLSLINKRILKRYDMTNNIRRNLGYTNINNENYSYALSYPSNSIISLNENTYGELIDPFGGIEAIEHKTIKTPLEPGITFSDDPLRMMRAIRFATQLQFVIEPNTYKAIAQNAERIKIISKE